MTDVPPKPSHAGSLVATAILLVTWIALTAAAPAIAPWIAAVAEDVEVGLGLDVLPGTRKKTSERKDGK